MMYMPAIVGAVYVLMEVVKPAKTVDIGGRKAEGMCIWTGGVRGRRVHEIVFMVGVFDNNSSSCVISVIENEETHVFF